MSGFAQPGIGFFLPLLIMFYGGWIFATFSLLFLVGRLVFGSGRLRGLEAENRRLQEELNRLQTAPGTS